MSPATVFQIHLVLGYVPWLLCFGAYVWPRLKAMDQVEAQRAIATLHSFRFFGLVFIVPGVVGPNLPAGFATFAAYGDFATGVLAIVALLTVRDAVRDARGLAGERPRASQLHADLALVPRVAHAPDPPLARFSNGVSMLHSSDNLLPSAPNGLIVPFPERSRDEILRMGQAERFEKRLVDPIEAVPRRIDSKAQEVVQLQVGGRGLFGHVNLAPS
jgi:hypothetical protein